MVSTKKKQSGMSAIISDMKQLRKKYAFEHAQGFVQTDLEGVSFFWVNEPVDRCPLIYEAGIVIIGQGHKVGYLENQTFRYDKDNYLLVSVSMPFECSTYATPEEPLLGIFIDIDLSELHELITLIAEGGGLPEHFNATATLRGVETVPMDRKMRNSVKRLTESLCSPMESKILGRGLVKEVIYRALLGDHGSALYALTQHNTHYNRIAKVLSHIRRNYAENLTIDLLANEACMSVSSFHRSFRKVTGSSPLQYLKKVRLNRARSLIVHDGLRTGTAAFEVGYESASQFSREFRRYFGVTPKDAKKIGYEATVS